MESHQNSVSLYVVSVITVVVNSISFPFTFLLNLLVVMTVKRTPRLQSKANILLACLAVTDAFTGLITQPLYILWNMLGLLGVSNKYKYIIENLFKCFLRGLGVCSALHLMLVTCERLIAIRFTYHHSHLVTEQNIRLTVIVFWIISIFLLVFGFIIAITVNIKAVQSILNMSGVLIIISCILFIVSAYLILYRETLRQRKKIKNQQLPQEELQRVAKENKALKTTVLVVGAIFVCFSPIAFKIALSLLSNFHSYFRVILDSCILCTWANNFVILNSLINPLIYFWRQKEMRKGVFRLLHFSVVEPVQDNSR